MDGKNKSFIVKVVLLISNQLHRFSSSVRLDLLHQNHLGHLLKGKFWS